MAKIKCPAWGCGSTNVVPVSSKKSFKKGKGLIGGVLGAAVAGPIGGMVGVGTGFNGKKKVKFICQDCGKVFEAKV